MSGAALNTVIASVQLVYHAYVKVRTNRERCARLVERCQMVVDRLQRLVATNGDGSVRDRIHQLETAFEYVAQTIIAVGCQGVITSLLHSDANALQVEMCNNALTELIALFSLEEIVDIGRWQRDLESARLRDQEELLCLGQRIESGNAALMRELAQQGTTINEVYRMVQDVKSNLPNPQAAYWSAPTTPAHSPPSSRPSSSCSVLPSNTMSSSARSSPGQSSVSSGRPIFPRRLSWTARIRKRPVAVMSKLTSPSQSRSADSSGVSEKSCRSVTSTRSASHSKALKGLPRLLDSPPPPYQLCIQNPDSDDRATTSDGEEGTEENLNDASIRAVRAPDSPVPTLLWTRPSSSPVFAPPENTPKGVKARRRRRHSATASPLRHKDSMVLRRKTTSLASHVATAEAFPMPRS
ncbi:hypothetical protein EW146_g1406 [Bondarzewia mesenterica]|uniref:Mixed lineage kinase domain-containing protein n=1 Tax=Bondarzewia mesenterica TaxID=1095465 RepID=A0A4S4M401_9AGAM|nr:hypothetical protein EW146_g1406 [Bondarzewia mesenterica]